MAESEQISWAYVKLENEAEIFSAWIDSKYPFKITVPFYMAWFLAADQLITCIVSVFLTTAFNLAGAESICSEDTRSMINSVIQ